MTDNEKAPPGYSEPSPAGATSASQPHHEPAPHGTSYGGMGVVSNLPFGFDLADDAQPFIVAYTLVRPLDGVPPQVGFNFGQPFADAVDKMCQSLRGSRQLIEAAMYDETHPGHAALRDFMQDGNFRLVTLLAGPGLAEVIQPYVRLRRLGERDKLILAQTATGLALMVGGALEMGVPGGGQITTRSGACFMHEAAAILAAAWIVASKVTSIPPIVSVSRGEDITHHIETAITTRTESAPESVKPSNTEETSNAQESINPETDHQKGSGQESSDSARKRPQARIPKGPR